MCVWCMCRYCTLSTQPPNQSQPWCASRCVCLVYQAAAAITRSSRLPHRRQLVTTCAVRGVGCVSGTGSGLRWVVSQPYGKVALGFLAYFYACLVDFFFRFFSLFFCMGCGGNFNIRGQKRRPRLRPKLTPPALVPPCTFCSLVCTLWT